MSKYLNNSTKEPQLIDDQTFANVTNKIQNKPQNYTDTNMMVEFFANSEKLVDSDKRIYHHIGNIENNDEINDEEENNLDDDLNKYRPVQNNIFDSNIKNEHSYHEPEILQKEEQYNTEKKKESFTDSSTIQNKEYNPEDESTWTKEELLLGKLDMLRKLGELSQCGVKLSNNYSINSNYRTMKFEYDLHTGIRSKQNAINWMSGMMIGIVKGVEMLNDNYNPFDIKFENTWSNKVTSDISDYYDVIGEIYEKYTTPGKKIAPELKLFLMLTGSAISIQMHKGITGLVPNASNDLDNNPNLINEMRQKAEQEETNRRNTIDERIEKEHKVATDKLADLQLINNAQTEYTNIQKMANSKNMEKFNNTMILSESAKSTHKQKDLIDQNQKLLDIQKMLQNMRNEENKKYNVTNVDTASKKISKVSNIIEDDNSSTKSSASSIFINPNLENILGKKNTNSDMTNSTKSTITPIKIINKNNAENNITFESISFGKKSNMSNGSGNIKFDKKKNMKIKIGK